MQSNPKKKILSSFSDCLNSLHSFYNPYNKSKNIYIIIL